MEVSVDLWTPKIGKVYRKIKLAEGSSILNLFDALSEMHGHFSEELMQNGEPSGIVFVNDRAVRNWKRTLSHGEEVSILPIVAGG